jgi:hypothetical protein
MSNVRARRVSTQPTSLAEIIVLIERAAGLLTSAEGAWLPAVETELSGMTAPEVAAIEELFHVATHETANALAFTVQDIQNLLARLAVRAKYKNVQR